MSEANSMGSHEQSESEDISMTDEEIELILETEMLLDMAKEGEIELEYGEF